MMMNGFFINGAGSKTIKKDKDAKLDYTLDWADWLLTDTISTSTWPVFPAGLTLESNSNTTTKATAWISGGTIGETYTVTNRIVSAGGRTEDRSFKIEVVEK